MGTARCKCRFRGLGALLRGHRKALHDVVSDIRRAGPRSTRTKRRRRGRLGAVKGPSSQGGGPTMLPFAAASTARPTPSRSSEKSSAFFKLAIDLSLGRVTRCYLCGCGITFSRRTLYNQHCSEVGGVHIHETNFSPDRVIRGSVYDYHTTEPCCWGCNCVKAGYPESVARLLLECIAAAERVYEDGFIKPAPGLECTTPVDVGKREERGDDLGSPSDTAGATARRAGATQGRQPHSRPRLRPRKGGERRRWQCLRCLRRRGALWADVA